MKLLITGGSGFIGSAVIRYIIGSTNDEVVNLDKLTYAGNQDNLVDAHLSDRYFFEEVDICDYLSVKNVFDTHAPDAVMHLAAESHVDRSIINPSSFIHTNVVGTYTMLEVSRNYWEQLPAGKRADFRFHHISTDEVFGDLDPFEDPFTECTPYAPSSPYSASKAGADHLVRAWGRTYKLPTLLTNCSNNYGPHQFPEKLIPLITLNALSGKVLPIYGDGSQVRDWLYVEDHARALYHVITRADVGQVYNIGGNNEVKNLDVVNAICDILTEVASEQLGPLKSYRELIRFVADRPGHDKRYAIDATKITRDLGWEPQETFDTGLRKTILWFVNNQVWCNRVLSGAYMAGKQGMDVT